MQAANAFYDLQLPMAQIAKVYVDEGIPVFPVRPGDRTPYLPKPSTGKGGFHQRSADPETVARWWKSYPDALVGIVPGDAGTVAYDTDSESAGRAAVARGLLDLNAFRNGPKPAGLVVKSAGKSRPFQLDGVTLPPMHLYFEVPPDISTGAVKLEGEVTRYRHGYVVAPGSWRKDPKGICEYELLSSSPAPPLPAWPEAKPTLELPTDPSGVPTALAILEGAELHQGSRHSGLLKVSANLARYLPSETALLAWMRRIDADQCMPPLSSEGSDGKKELASIAETAWKKYGGFREPNELYNQLTGLLQELEGLDGPQRAAREAQRLGEFARKIGTDRRWLRQILDEMRLSERQRNEQWSSIDPGHQLVDEIVEAGNPYLVQDVLFQQADHVLYGPPEALKTFVALDVAGAIATDRPWLGEREVVTPGAVVMFAGEGQINLRRRFAAWLQARGISAEEAQRIPIRIYDQLPILGRGDDGLHAAIEKVEKAQEELGQPVQLIILDTLTRLSGRAGSSQTDVKEFGALLDDISALGKRFGASTLTLAHNSKSDQHNPSGTYQLSANADCVIAVKRMDNSGSELRTVLCFKKTKDGERPRDIHIRFERQDFHNFLAQSLASRDKEPLDSDAALDTRYTSLAAIWDGNTEVPPEGEVSGKSGLTEREWNVLNVLARLCAESADSWVSQQSLFKNVHSEYERLRRMEEVTSPISETTLRRILRDGLARKRGLAAWRYVDRKRKQAGILWTLTEDGEIEVSGVCGGNAESETTDRCGDDQPPTGGSADDAPTVPPESTSGGRSRQTAADDRDGGAK
jgi:hypothetical protein